MYVQHINIKMLELFVICRVSKCKLIKRNTVGK